MRQADVDFVVRTDLAIEERERVWESGSEIAGVRMREWEAADAGIRVTEVLVCDERGEEALGKPVGVYLTLDAPSLAKKDEDYHREVSEELSGLLRGMFVDHGLEAERMERPVRTLVVGLGNPEATPDALGPKVLEHLQATRASGDGVRDGFLLEAWISDPEWDHTGSHGADGDGDGGDRKGDRAGDRAGCPVIVVDALAARSAGRLGVTVQLADTGIRPGSGVGNHRSGLTEETLGIPVFAIGIPMVVGAAAIVYDTVGAMTEMLRERVECGSGDEEKGTKKEKTKKEAIKTEETEEDKETRKNGGKWTKEEPRRREEKRMIPEMLRVEEAFELVKELLKPDLGPMYVTPHDIDERVDFLSYTISEAIHGALFYNK